MTERIKFPRNVELSLAWLMRQPWLDEWLKQPQEINPVFPVRRAESIKAPMLSDAVKLSVPFRYPGQVKRRR